MTSFFPEYTTRAVVLALLLVATTAHADSLYLVRPDGGDLRLLTPDPTRGYGSPDWAPDGERIAFDTWPLGVPNEDYALVQIGLADAPFDDAGDEPEALVLLGDGAMPSWSPDGTQIVCHTYPVNSPRSSHHIVVINADGSGREAVLDQWGSPRWNPDGRTIVTVHNSGLAAFDLPTGRQTPLVRGGDATVRGSVQLGFSISPDGRRYAVAPSGGGLAIGSEDEVEGGLRLRMRVPRPAWFRHSSWSPDGERLVVMMRPTQGEKARLYLLSADGNDPPKPIPGIPADWDCLDPDWSPDGEWIAFCARPESDEE